MKFYVLIILFLFKLSTAETQTIRTNEEIINLNIKSGFRKFLFGTSLHNFYKSPHKEISDSRSDERAFILLNENFNIGPAIKAQRIIYNFHSYKFSEVSIIISSGSKELHNFLIREYGEPDIKLSVNSDSTLIWKGNKSYIQLGFIPNEENAMFIITSAQYYNDNEIRKGF